MEGIARSPQPAPLPARPPRSRPGGEFKFAISDFRPIVIPSASFDCHRIIVESDMSKNSKYLERGPGELTLFAVTFAGFIITASGIVTLNAGVTLTGFVLMFIAVSYFVTGKIGEGD